jgi:ubiquinone/menaquinone biosynthesis C-methylase UbiE
LETIRNLLDEKPARDLHGRVLYTSRFVSDEDLRDKDVLELGCGYGWFTLNALDRGVRSYTGIEPAPGALETAARHITAPNTRLLVADALQLPFESASFDTVVCWDTAGCAPPTTSRRLC